MDAKKIIQILSDTAYVRTGGSDEELRCARYLQQQCAALGLEATLEEFEVPGATIRKAVLLADGNEIPCKGYLCAGSGTVTAPLYYLRSDDKLSLSRCQGRIVMIDGYLGYWKYQDLLEHGAVGFITYDGNANYADEDIDQRELRSYVSKGRKIPGVNINAKQAIALIRDNVQTVEIRLEQEEYTVNSRNVVLELPGEIPQTITVTAHYDSTSLSQGAYDNMSGSIGLLALAERFLHTPHRYGLRFIWCGSEERGLLGSKAYVAAHEDSLSDIALSVNMDMLGCIMGAFHGYCCADEKLGHFVEYLASIHGVSIAMKNDVHSSDSTPFADKGIPALSFARYAPPNTGTIHNSYDTAKLMKPEQLLADLDFIGTVVETLANSKFFPVPRQIPDTIKEKLDVYLLRKRKSN